jgi:hypothetical protein
MLVIKNKYHETKIGHHCQEFYTREKNEEFFTKRFGQTTALSERTIRIS